MKPDTGWMKSQFVAFNRRYFQTRLPLPQFRVSNARTFLGNMRWREDRIRHKYYDFKLTMSVYYDLEEKELQNVMLHEMIHYYIAYHHLKDTSPHGRVFCGIMDKLNACGWDIRISHRHSAANEASSEAPSPGRRLIGVFFVRNEIFYAVINPRYVGKIINGLSRVADFKKLEWYISSDDDFKKMPIIRSLRGYKINEERLEELKKKMTPVVLKEGMII